MFHLSQSQMYDLFSVFWTTYILKFSWKKTTLQTFSFAWNWYRTGTDPDWPSPSGSACLDADPDPDSAKWCRSVPIRIHNTVINLPIWKTSGDWKSHFYVEFAVCNKTGETYNCDVELKTDQWSQVNTVSMFSRHLYRVFKTPIVHQHKEKVRHKGLVVINEFDAKT